MKGAVKDDCTLIRLLSSLIHEWWHISVATRAPCYWLVERLASVVSNQNMITLQKRSMPASQGPDRVLLHARHSD